MRIPEYPCIESYLVGCDKEVGCGILESGLANTPRWNTGPDRNSLPMYVATALPRHGRLLFAPLGGRKRQYEMPVISGGSFPVFGRDHLARARTTRKINSRHGHLLEERPGTIFEGTGPKTRARPTHLATRSRRLPGIPEIILVVRRHVSRDVVPGVTRAAGLVETAVVGDVAPRRLGRFDAGLEANPGARGHADEGDDAAHELVEALARLDSVVPVREVFDVVRGLVAVAGVQVDGAAGDVGVPLEELGRGIDVGRRLGGTLRGGKGREFMVEGVGQPLVQLLTGAPVVHHVGAIGLALRDTDDRR
ncbi:hypothetical protein PG996_004685 [Apiospora saccharicola]|uniref:Uncharacterized protein n=1 Tax=Apiospora saccharicola TaxID=335842 RepID=A0ABR1W7N3_9PEZI